MGGARCLKCRQKLGELERQEERLFFVSRRGGYTWHMDGRGEDWVECSCGEKYRLKRREDGFVLEGEIGSMVVE